MLENNNPDHKIASSDDLAINRDEQDSGHEELLLGQKLAKDTQISSWEISRQFTKLAIPTVLSCIFMQLVSVINIVFVGQLNDAAKLAGCGLGNTLASICGFSIMVGLNGAIDTLASHAFGDNDLRLCGVYLNRGRMILLAFSIPLAVLMSLTRQILTGIGQDPLVSHYAHLYVVYQLPGNFLMG
jgi:Na+-driven multidrug efflux pump